MYIYVYIYIALNFLRGFQWIARKAGAAVTPRSRQERTLVPGGNDASFQAGTNARSRRQRRIVGARQTKRHTHGVLVFGGRAQKRKSFKAAFKLCRRAPEG